MKISTYRSPLTNKRTMVVVSIGRTGHEGYREIQISYRMGHYQYQITEGYTWLTTGSIDGSKGLKTVINLLEGKAKMIQPLTQGINHDIMN